MSINASGWRPEAPISGGKTSPMTTGNKALMLEEALISEIGDTTTTGVDFERAPAQAGAQGSKDGARGSGFLLSQENINRRVRSTARVGVAWVGRRAPDGRRTGVAFEFAVFRGRRLRRAPRIGHDRFPRRNRCHRDRGVVAR